MKRTYKKPKTRVVAPQLRAQLLAVSGEISGYSRSSNSFSQDDEVSQDDEE